MKNTLTYMMLAILILASTGCKNGIIAKWRQRGATCSQCNTATVAPPTIASSPYVSSACASGNCSVGTSSPYMTASPSIIGSDMSGGMSSDYSTGGFSTGGYEIAPQSDSGYFGSSQGILPAPPGPIN